MSDCGFSLRVNGSWVGLGGVQRGVGVGFERPRDEFASVGNVRHDQKARRVSRIWNIDLGQLAGPEQVAALMVAAQGDGGDVMLWDESAARANLLDPVVVRGRDEYPLINCGGLVLRSLTAGPGSPVTTEDVQLKANATIKSDGQSSPKLATGPDLDSLVKVAVPATPAGMTLTSAALVLTPRSGTGGGIDAHHAPNSWTQPGGVQTTDYWTSVPAGALAGSATTATTTVIALSGFGAFAGSDMTLRLTQDSGSATFRSRDEATGYPVLRLTYEPDASPAVIAQHLKAGNYWLTAWTDAPGGTTIGSISSTAGSLPLVAPTGTGLRRVTIQLGVITSTADRDWTITIDASTTYLLGGLGLASLDTGTYLPGHKTPVRVSVDDPSLVLDMLLAAQQGLGQRAAVLREVG